MATKMFNRLFGSLFVLAVCGTGCVSVDAEVPEVTVTKRDLGFDALPIEGLPAQALVELMKERTIEIPPFTFEHGPIEFPEGFSSNLRTVGVQLVTNRGIKDFSFVRKMDVSISDGKNPPLNVASFDRDNGDTTLTNVLAFKTINAQDTMGLWQTDAITFSMSLTGTPPMEAWSMDVVARFTGEMAFDL
jgi:hypothetical protein